jgi:serine/threonine-protein kinase
MTAQARLLGGRYQVGELLGYGGMAEVHRGRDLRLGRDVAIKTLRTDLARDATFQMRFRREAQNAAALNHPAIVAVYDTGDERGPAGEELPYIVMEFVNGRTLKEVLAVEGRLMPRRALEITADICSALEFSHRHGIIHRDIKPGNVMLTQTGQVKVMDFGIARALASGASTMTQTSAVIGTAQYLSPEQARGEAVDARSDVYATGCVLYELLCGHPPFVGDNPVSVAYQHVREDPRAPSESNRDVPPDLDAVVLKALAKNPLNRYQSAGEMRADLLRAVAGRPVLATPVMREDDRMATMMAPQMARTGQPTRPVARAGDRPPPRRSSVPIAIALTLLGVLAVAALAAGLYLARTPMTTVPGLDGKTQAQAEQALVEAKLKSSPINTQIANCQPGSVIPQSQDPKQGERVKEGSTVSYQVCIGPGQTSVPPLVGLSKEDAQRALTQAHLLASFVTVDSDRPANQVVDSNPKVGTAIAQGSTVTVSLSLGNQVPMPDLNGLTQAQADQKLRSVGFTNIKFGNVDTSNPDLVGKVVRQSVPANTPWKKDQQINVFIGQSTTPTEPPSSPPHS